MTEQTDTEFWAQALAEDTAARGKQADPSACGTCRGRVANGEQVVHDECAQRATLLPAPDAPDYELILEMTEEQRAALPPRFHTPVFMDSSTPTMWVCAVCWGESWTTQWPCAAACQNGTRVFTSEHLARTAAKRQEAVLAQAQADAAEARARVAEVKGELVAAKERHQEGLRRADERLREMNAELQRYAEGTEAPVLWSVYNKMHGRAATAEARVAQLERELKKYVGAEPTVAEEMAYLSSCLDAVRDLCDEAEQRALRWEQPLPVPEWVSEVRKAAEGLVERRTYPPALPWAALMDDEDLHDFLGDLINALHSDRPTLDVLAEVEKTCASHRAIAEAQHAHNTAPGPSTE
ncbi:hypothetical protein ACFYOF_16790 [Streptomyces sp. NPDC007148]|uniref:hypothetical protein n=1 Tax=Streptomyces sp. NPDC007148 TaxID=3364775 RepID=UPI0036936567